MWDNGGLSSSLRLMATQPKRKLLLLLLLLELNISVSVNISDSHSLIYYKSIECLLTAHLIPGFLMLNTFVVRLYSYQ